ncbi:hypothetical protein D1F64_21550 [Breoghania sp. L-A4]|nr:hypothetical protein D1F64_21550 [Breoghania sp. L-A4]
MPSIVILGLVPRIHDFKDLWMVGTSPTMTKEGFPALPEVRGAPRSARPFVFAQWPAISEPTISPLR